jgi:hypothetical protein
MSIVKVWLISLIFCNGALAKNLCTQTGKVIFAFEAKNSKILSLCKERQGDYLVYRKEVKK